MKENKQRFVRTANDVQPDDNALDPNLRLQNEQPHHRTIIMLFAQGLNTRQVFETLGGKYDENNRPISGTGQFSYPWITQIRRQPWVRQRILKYQEEAGKPLIEDSIAAEASQSLQTIVELRDDPATPAAVRVRAAENLLDRYLGKPTQHVKTEVTTINQRLEEKESLDDQIRAVRAELASLGYRESGIN